MRHHRRHDRNPAGGASAGGEEGLESGNSVLLTDPVDQACGIQQRCCLVQKLLHVECDFEALLVKSRTRASVGCASYSRAFIEPTANFGQLGLDCCFD